MSEKKKEYTPAPAVQAALAQLQGQVGEKPGEYASGWENALRGVMERILNREPFAYNLDGDALYRQYRSQAQQAGRLAMADAAGQAAAMTGGYGNSYAQSAGQQAYGKELAAVNDRIPQLYQLALEQYRQQSDDLSRQYSMLADREDSDYSRWRTALEAWQQEADRLSDAYREERRFDYTQHRDAVTDSQWQQRFEEDRRRYDQEWAAAHPVARDSGGYVPTVSYTAPKPEEKPERRQQNTNRPVLL